MKVSGARRIGKAEPLAVHGRVLSLTLPDQSVENILRLPAKRRPVLQKIVWTLRARIERRSGHGEDFAAIIGREFRGDERAGPARRLHHHDGAGETRDDPVSPGEIAPARLPAERHFADRGAMLEDKLQQILVDRWIDPPKPPGEDRDGARLDRGLMRPRVDAARQSRDDYMAAAPDAARDQASEGETRGGGVARSDDGDLRSAEARQISPAAMSGGAASVRRSRGG
jgi:hypothetical protein